MTNNPLPLSVVTEDEAELGAPAFALNGNIAFRVVNRVDQTVVRFGELSTPTTVLFLVVFALAIGSVPLLVRFGIQLAIAVFPVIGVSIGFVIFILRQSDIKGIELCMESKRCIFRAGPKEQVCEPIEENRVINSHRFRNSAPATEGTSELFLLIGEAIS